MVVKKQRWQQVLDMARPKRVLVPLSADLERKLLLWAFLRDESLPTLLKNCGMEAVNAEWTNVLDELAEKAKRLNLSQEELEAKILKRAGFDFERERTELETENAEKDDR